MPNQNQKQNNDNLDPLIAKTSTGTKEQNGCPIKIETLSEYWNLMKQHYSRDHKRMRMLEQVDSSDLWKAMGAKFPSYQILPDTNFISY